MSIWDELDESEEAEEIGLEKAFEQALSEAVLDMDEVTDSYSFEEGGLMTRNKGVTVRTADGHEYQLTIVRSR